MLGSSEGPPLGCRLLTYWVSILQSVKASPYDVITFQSTHSSYHYFGSYDFNTWIW
jgi:hypothetical protein